MDAVFLRFDCTKHLLVFAQYSCLVESFAHLVAVPLLQIVNDRYVINFLVHVPGKAMDPVEFLCEILSS
jgi:hypothetical protein